MIYKAQRYGSWEWLDLNLRITTDGPEWTDSSYGSMKGTIAPELGRRTADDGMRIIEPWGTLIHVETAFDRRWTGIVTEVVPEGKDLQVTVTEWNGYLDGLTFQGRIWGVKADPADLVRELFAEVQSRSTGDLGITVTGSTPLRIGSDSTDKALLARAAVKKAKAALDAKVKARTAKQKQIQTSSKPYATQIKSLEAARKAAADKVSRLSKAKTGKNGASKIYWVAPTSTVSQWVHDGHAGTDFAVPQGTPVAACVDGVVVLTGDDGRGAWCVHVKRADGLVVQAGHLSRIDVKRGQRVSATTRIGLSGGAPGSPGAGVSTGPHIHWELRWHTPWSGAVVDPRSLNPGSLGVPPSASSAELDAARHALSLAQDALAAKKVQRDQAIAPLKTQLAALKAQEAPLRTALDKAQETSRKADEREREDKGAYRVLAADNPDCWRVLRDLCDETGMRFTTHTTRTDGKPKLELRLHYPGLGTTRDDLIFQQGLNVVSKLKPASKGEYAQEIIVLGAGEGEKSIRQSAAKTDPRLYRNSIVDDKRITTLAKAGTVARAELARRTTDLEIAEITVVDHPLCRIWSWGVGDIITLQGRVAHFGQVTLKHRVTAWSLAGDHHATLRLERA